MTCMNCGASLPDNVNNCTQCGASGYTAGNENSGSGASTNSRKCPTCGFASRDGGRYCDNCGQPLSAPPPSSAPTSAYSQQNTSAQWPYNMASNSFSAQQNSIVKTSTYIKWMLLMMIPVAGFIAAIIFAIDNKDQNRSNYFKAVLLLQVVGVVLGILFYIVFLALGFSLLQSYPEFSNEYSEWGDYLRMFLAAI